MERGASARWAPRSSCFARRRRRRARQLDGGRATSSSGSRQLLSRFRPDSELSRLNRDGRLDAGADLVARRRARARGARAHRRPLRPDRPRRARRGRLRPHVRAVAPTAAGDGTARPVRRARSTIDRPRGSSSTRASASTSAASPRATPSTAPASCSPGRPLPRQRRRRPRRPRRRRWPVGVEPPTADHARALDGALATSGRDRRRWRRGGERAAPPDRPGDRRARRRPTSSASPSSPPTRVEAEVLAKALFLAGEATARAEADASGSPAVLVTATASARREGRSHEDRPDVLAARAGERPHRLRASDAVRARGPRRQVAPVRRGGEAGAVTDLHRFLACLGLGALAVHGVALVLDQTVHIAPAGAARPGPPPYRPLWTALGVVAGELVVLIYRLVLPAQADRREDWRRLHWVTYGVFVAGDRPRPRAGTDTARPWALGLYLGAVGAVAFATAWRALVRPTPSPPRSTRLADRSTPKGGPRCTGSRSTGRSVAASALRRARPTSPARRRRHRRPASARPTTRRSRRGLVPDGRDRRPRGEGGVIPHRPHRRRRPRRHPLRRDPAREGFDGRASSSATSGRRPTSDRRSRRSSSPGRDERLAAPPARVLGRARDRARARHPRRRARRPAPRRPRRRRASLGRARARDRRAGAATAPGAPRAADARRRAARCASELRPGRRLAVVGGGFVGAEVASTALALGVDVTMSSRSGPVPATLGDEVGRLLAERYLDPASTSGSPRPHRSGTRARLAAVGAEPAAELLGGVATDACGRTAFPGVYACGDVARSGGPRSPGTSGSSTGRAPPPRAPRSPGDPRHRGVRRPPVLLVGPVRAPPAARRPARLGPRRARRRSRLVHGPLPRPRRRSAPRCSPTARTRSRHCGGSYRWQHEP